MAFAIMLGIQSCIPDPPKPTVNANDFDFKAVNLTVNDGNLTATGGNKTTTYIWVVSLTVNGETSIKSGTRTSNELPVMAGDEIEIYFTPSCPEQTEAYFTMPDGTSHTASVSASSFKWIVPDNFTAGMQIKGESHYETGDCIYNRTGTITLIALK